MDTSCLECGDELLSDIDPFLSLDFNFQTSVPQQRQPTPADQAHSSVYACDCTGTTPPPLSDPNLFQLQQPLSDASDYGIQASIVEELMQHNLGLPLFEGLQRSTSAFTLPTVSSADRRTTSAPPRYKHIPIPLRYDPQLDHRKLINHVAWLVFLHAATVRTVQLRLLLADPANREAILIMDRTDFPAVVQLFPKMAKCRSMLELFYKDNIFVQHHLGSMFETVDDPYRPFRLVLTPPREHGDPMDVSADPEETKKQLLDNGHVLLTRKSNRATPQRECLVDMALRPPSTHAMATSLSTSTEATGLADSAPSSKRAKKAVADKGKQQHTTLVSYLMWAFDVLPLEAGCHTNISPDAPVANLCNWGCTNEKPAKSREPDLYAPRRPDLPAPRAKKANRCLLRNTEDCRPVLMQPLDDAAGSHPSPLAGPPPSGEPLRKNVSSLQSMPSLGSFSTPRRASPSLPAPLMGTSSQEENEDAWWRQGELELTLESPEKHFGLASKLEFEDQVVSSAFVHEQGYAQQHQQVSQAYAQSNCQLEYQPKDDQQQLYQELHDPFHAQQQNLQPHLQEPSTPAPMHPPLKSLRPHKTVFRTPTSALCDKTNGTYTPTSARRTSSSSKKHTKSKSSSPARVNLRYAKRPKDAYLKHMPDSPMLKNKQLVCFCGNPAHHARHGQPVQEAVQERARYIQKTLQTCVAKTVLPLKTDEATRNGCMPCFCPDCFQSSIAWLNREFKSTNKNYFPLKIEDSELPHVRAYLISLRNDGCDPYVRNLDATQLHHQGY
eukprot:TRINITY_DN10518_c0_g2_i2.p1 TRINITY_DN10518_c0_g2~~TRINITY_DN10518_c0_g2_i2.p1  ORF type:complete len:779 (+),score=203.47 TRINITY_DN10518_c0_g2_i2:232-2568(+)